MANISTSTVSYATRQQTGTIVFFANDGSVCVLWNDGTNQVFSYAANSAGTVWTKQTLVTGTRMLLAGHIRSNDIIDVVTGGAAVNTPQYYPLTKVGASWVLGTPNIIDSTAAGSLGIGNVANYAGQDTRGRHWTITGATSTYLSRRILYSPANSPTTTAWTVAQSGAQTADINSPAGDIVGNYTVEIWWNGTALQWDRADNSGVSVGAFSANATIPNLTGSPNASSVYTFKAISPTRGLLVYTTTTGIYAQLYTAATDTWGAATQLSSGGSDVQPSIATDFQGNAWVVWCQFAAANSYALVYKSYQGGTWSAAASTVIASGTNIQWPNAAFNAVNGAIGVAYTVGTVTPWTVGWVAFGGRTARTAAGRMRLRLDNKPYVGRMKFGLTPYQAGVLSDGAYGYYLLNENDGSAKDFTGSGRTGYAHGAVTYQQPTPLRRSTGSSMLFDGATGYVSLPVENALGGASAISVEAWFQLSNLTFENNPRIISCDDAATGHLGYLMYIANGGTSVNFIVGNGTIASTATMTQQLTAGRWYHVVGTYDGANVRIYLNGSVGGTVTALTGAVGASNIPPTIARNVHSTVDWFPGYVDDVSFYKSALSAATAANHLVLGTGIRDWDEWGRANNASGWSTPPSSVTWTTTAGPVYSLTSGVAAITSTAGGSYFATRTATGISANNSIVADVKGSLATSSWGVVVCFTDATTHYRLVISGTAGTLQFQKNVTGSGSFLGSAYTIPSFSIANTYSLRATFSNGVLYGKVWLAGTTEPDGYNIIVADASLITGNQGLYFFPNTASSAVLNIDNVFQEDATLYIPVTATKLATGRIRIATQTTRNALGRVRVVGRTLQNATGRFTSAVAATRNATGRLRFIVVSQTTRNATGRFKSGTIAARNAMGRVRNVVVSTRSAVGRVRFKGQTANKAAGRLVLRGQTARNATGRFKAVTQSTKSGVGRVRLVVTATKSGMGRVRFKGQATRIATGRLRLGVVATKNATGRFKAINQTLRNAIGRIKIIGQTSRVTVGRVVLMYGGDSFGRANNPSSWGTSFDGATWQSFSLAGAFTPAISSLKGTLVSTSNSTNIMTYDVGGWGPNGSVQVDTSQNVSTNATGLVYRFTDATHYYRLDLSNGLLRIAVVNGGAAFIGTSYTLPGYVLGTTYTIRFTCIGSLLLGKIWATGTAEPSGYQISAIDATQTGGRTGVYGFSGTATSSTLTYDNFYITDYTNPMKSGVGRMNVVAQAKRNATGRIRLAVLSTRNATGREKVIGQTTRTTTGRMRIGILTLRNALGRVRISLGSTRNALGRMGVRGRATRNALGRMRVALTTTKTATGRLRLIILATRNGVGRLRFASQVAKNATGRLRYKGQTSRTALGRFILYGRTTRNTVGRIRLVLVATRNGVGRLRLTLGSTRNSTGRLKYVTSVAKNAVGRLRLKGQAVRNASGRVVFKGRTTANATGRVRIGTQVARNATGRIRVRGIVTRNAIGRLRFNLPSTPVTRNALGRFILRGLSTRNGFGRFRVGVLTSLKAAGRIRLLGSTTKNATGRIRFFPQVTKNAVGRMRYVVLTTKNTLGRLTLAGKATRTATGRFILKGRTTRNALGRVFLLGRTTSNAIGRLRFGTISSTALRNATGRMKFFPQRTRNAVGRMRVRGQTSLQAIGRIKFQLSHGTTRNVVGRMRVVALFTAKKNALGRLFIAALAHRNATGRIKILGRSTYKATGRMKFFPLSVRKTLGRIRIALRTTRNATGRFILRGKTLRNATGRFVLRGRTVRNARGRLFYTTLAMRKAVGRLVLRGHTTRLSLGRMRFAIQTRRNAQGRLYFKVLTRRNAQGRVFFASRIAHQAKGRVIFFPQTTRNAQGRFVVVLASVDAVFTLPHNGVAYDLPDNSVTYKVPDNSTPFDIPDNETTFRLPDNTVTYTT